MELTNDRYMTKIIDIVSRHDSINRIGVFGSYARGENVQESDIDLLYDYDDSKIHDTIKCLGEIQRQLDKSVDFIAYEDLLEVTSEHDIKLKDNVLKDIIWIYKSKITI